jgi:hypothetical protein
VSTSYRCVASGPGWNITYTVNFSGGTSWYVPGTYSTTTGIYQRGIASTNGAPAPGHTIITFATIMDEADVRLVNLPLPSPIQVNCPH